MGVSLPSYVLITPARNESAFIEKTILSVISQTILPLRWVIVSDGSTDGMDDIVGQYAANHSWIELIRLPERKERHFAGKVNAFNAGYAAIRELNYEVIGNLDADITFDEGQYEFLLRKFSENSSLGVAGPALREQSSKYDYRFTSIEHVSGCCQMFRRKCFEDIGGYTAIKMGGIDLVAVMTARMKGWQTRTFPEKTCVHHREMGTAKQNALMVALRGGHGDYRLGTHPLWEFLRSFYQGTRRPIVLGACFRLAGFTWALITGAEKLISPELVRFRRAEQMRRLRDFIRSSMPLQKERLRST